MLLEPPGSHLPGRPPPADGVQLRDGGAAGAGPTELAAEEPERETAPDPSTGQLGLAALAAAAALAATSSGDVVLLAVLLGLAAGDLTAGVTAALALAALAVRWGSTSLDAIAGAQAVLGAGGLVGPAAAVAAAWAAAAALVLAPRREWQAVAFGAAAAVCVAGPSIAGPGDAAVRGAGVMAGIGTALALGRRVPVPARRRAALGSAAAALALALVS